MNRIYLGFIWGFFIGLVISNLNSNPNSFNEILGGTIVCMIWTVLHVWDERRTSKPVRKENEK